MLCRSDRSGEAVELGAGDGVAMAGELDGGLEFGAIVGGSSRLLLLEQLVDACIGQSFPLDIEVLARIRNARIANQQAVLLSNLGVISETVSTGSFPLTL
jgi:hypothetical protein